MDTVKVNTYNQMIAELDDEHATKLSNEAEPTGNNAAIYDELAKRMLAQRDYENNRRKLVELRDDAIGASLAVEQYLTPKKVVSKFEVDKGTFKPDTSLNPLGGKTL